MKLLTLALAAVAAFVILAVARPVPAAADVTSDIQRGLCAGSNLRFDGKCVRSNSNTEKLNKFIRNIINILSALVGVVAVIMIIIGGFRYITSGGNDTSVTGAKNTILYAVIGLIIVALAQVIVHFVLQKVTNT